MAEGAKNGYGQTEVLSSFLFWFVGTAGLPLGGRRTVKSPQRVKKYFIYLLTSMKKIEMDFSVLSHASKTVWGSLPNFRTRFGSKGVGDLPPK